MFVVVVWINLLQKLISSTIDWECMSSCINKQVIRSIIYIRSVVVIFWCLCSEIHIVFYLSICCWSLCCVQLRIYLFITWVCYAIPCAWIVVINTLVSITIFGTSPWSSSLCRWWNGFCAWIGSVGPRLLCLPPCVMLRYE